MGYIYIYSVDWMPNQASVMEYAVKFVFLDSGDVFHFCYDTLRPRAEGHDSVKTQVASVGRDFFL